MKTKLRKMKESNGVIPVSNKNVRDRKETEINQLEILEESLVVENHHDEASNLLCDMQSKKERQYSVIRRDCLPFSVIWSSNLI